MRKAKIINKPDGIVRVVFKDENYLLQNLGRRDAVSSGSEASSVTLSTIDVKMIFKGTIDLLTAGIRT